MPLISEFSVFIFSFAPWMRSRCEKGETTRRDRAYLFIPLFEPRNFASRDTRRKIWTLLDFIAANTHSVVVHSRILRQVDGHEKLR